MRSLDEIPTILLLSGTYAGFVTLSLAMGALPIGLIVIGLGFVIALHSSLQHEVLHGHPFGKQWLSDATVFPAIGLFIPYLRFKDLHLAHHFDPNLTDPYDDPETNFLDVRVWDQMPAVLRYLARFNNTLLGRMLVGPVIGLVNLYNSDIRAMLRGNRRIAASYLVHLAALAIPLIWIVTMTSLPIWAYLSAAYFGLSLLRIRTYLEHQAHERAAARSVIIEDRGPLALLFLNNNFHAVHHAHPKVAWHRLPEVFETRRDIFIKRNGGYVYRSYAQIFAQYLFRAKDPVVHPMWSEINRTQPKRTRP